MRPGSPWTRPGKHRKAQGARAVLLGLSLSLALAACDYTRPAESVVADRDVVTLAIVIVAGESEARLVAVHPHRSEGEEAPEVDAVLRGPNWTARFSRQAEFEVCDDSRRDIWGGATWIGSVSCHVADLPEPIKASQPYGLEGTAASLAFTGAVVMPPPPVLLEPWDTLEVALPDDGSRVEVPIRYRTDDSAVGMTIPLVVELPDTLGDRSGAAMQGSGLPAIPPVLADAVEDTVTLRFRNEARVSLRLLGVGWHYTNFLELHSQFPVPEPLPSFGITGEGVYGYFAGASPSRMVVLIAR